MSFRVGILKVAVAVLLMLNVLETYGQQMSLFSHYYWNEQFYNPAYAGSKEVLHVQAVNRLQWVGMNGAPNTLSAAVHTPLKKENIAIGINFYNDRIGALMTNGVTGQYAYRLRFKENKYTLSLGIQAGAEFRNLQSSRLTTDDGLPDIVDPSQFQKSWMPIFGTGAYFYGENFSVGFGVPQLLPKSLFKGEKWGMEPSTQFFVSGAYQWNISEDFRLLPTATIRIQPAQPTQAEFTVNGIFYDRFLLGAGMRTDKSGVVLGQYIHEFEGKKKLSVGYSYDISWKALRTTNSGSHEIMLSFGMPVFKPSSVLYKSPRYF